MLRFPGKRVLAKQKIYIGEDDGQRGFELMRGVGDKLPLLLPCRPDRPDGPSGQRQRYKEKDCQRGAADQDGMNDLPSQGALFGKGICEGIADGLSGSKGLAKIAQMF